MLELKHYPTKHTWQGKERYHITPTGDKYPGVTTILSATKTEKSKQILDNWKQDKSEYELNFGKARGRWLHEKIESYLDFSRPEPDLNSISQEFKADYTNDEETFTQWWDSVEPILDDHCNHPVLIESALWDDELMVAGTMDCLAFWDGELCLCDWKTSKDWMNPNWDSVQDYFCQLAAYRRMINRVYAADGIEVSKAVLVVAVPNGKAQVFTLELAELEVYEAKWIRKVKKFYREKNLMVA